MTRVLPVYAAPVEGAAVADAIGAVELGVGKVDATIALVERLQADRAELVLVFGVCGVFPAEHRAAASACTRLVWPTGSLRAV